MKKGNLVKCILITVLPGNKIAPPLVLSGDPYRVLGTHVCNCGELHLDIGLANKDEYNITCYKCREVLPGTTWWAHSSRFELL